MRRSLLFAVLVAVAFSAIGTKTPDALAKDSAPCGRPYEDHGRVVQKCPLWRGDVPVTRFGNEVGQLAEGGKANWFVCQWRFPDQPYEFDEYHNTWYALTEADNGEVGWVSEVFFAGGNNDEPDANLRHCGPSDFDPSNF